MMGRTVLVLLILNLMGGIAPAHAVAPVTECDRLAAHPLDEHRVTDGVDWRELDGAAALAACEAAIELHPNEARFAYQRARALDRLGRIEEAIAIQDGLAAQGYAAAQTMLGYLYAAGDGVAHDPARATALFAAAAEQGHPEAQLQLGLMLRRGAGVPPDREAAFRWLERSAVQGYRDGQLALAGLLADEARSGLDERRFRAAAEWYELAAAQGSEFAAIALGRFTLEGRGVPRNVARAIELLEPPAQGGLAEAQYWLAIAFSADGDRDNDDGVLRWHLRAAEQDYAPAQAALVGLYQTGDFAERSPANAYVWAKLYARFAPRYERVAEHIARELTAAELARATGEFERIRATVGTP